MIALEARRHDGIDFIAIVTPNHLHLPIARAAMEAGLHVMSDKPATANLQEALDLQRIVDQTRCLYALTFTYTGYPLVRELCRSGAIGTIRKVLVEYLQGWLSTPLKKQARSRPNGVAIRQSPVLADVSPTSAFMLSICSNTFPASTSTTSPRRCIPWFPAACSTTTVHPCSH